MGIEISRYVDKNWKVYFIKSNDPLAIDSGPADTRSLIYFARTTPEGVLSERAVFLDSRGKSIMHLKQDYQHACAVGQIENLVTDSLKKYDKSVGKKEIPKDKAEDFYLTCLEAIMDQFPLFQHSMLLCFS